MPSISGLVDKLDNVMKCIGVSIDATNDYAVQSPLMVAQGQCSELRNNIV